MYLCKRDLSRECEGGYKDCTDCVLSRIRAEIEAIIGEHNSDDYDFCSGLICARKIIDKYKSRK